VIAGKMGLGKFQLRALLDDYLGAVQLVAEFEDYGERIFGQFAKVMRALVDKHQNVTEIYIVSHSEGTVVSFRSLLAALAVRGGEDERWVKLARGFMTIGSPIDKHIVMWQNLWKQFHEREGKPWAEVGVQMPQAIVWWNYYDNGDPVGFNLDSTRLWLQDHLWVKVKESETGTRVLADKEEQPFFDFPEGNDRGFTRYFLPGKAHVDYWNDPGVFGHFLSTVMEPARAYPAPTSKFLPKIVSWILPYVICLLLLMGGTYMLDRAIDPFLPKAKPIGLAVAAEKLQTSATAAAQIAANINTAVSEAAGEPAKLAAAKVPVPKADSAGAKIDREDTSKEQKQTLPDSDWEPLPTVFGLACLLGGITVMSRIPRLVKIGGWHLVSAAAFVLGAWAYCSCVSPRVQGDLGAALPWIPGSPCWRIIWLAAGISIVSSVLSKLWPQGGMKPLMGLAAGATGCVVWGLISREGAIRQESPLWPLFLAGAAFLYLWWLVALIFDLTFVWHRYIRSNATTELLMKIRDKRRTASARQNAAAA